ncbi:MAG: hypothetical protein PHE84_05155 [bacterium]|nr:hypothetical protein [bacterium]
MAAGNGETYSSGITSIPGDTNIIDKPKSPEIAFGLAIMPAIVSGLLTWGLERTGFQENVGSDLARFWYISSLTIFAPLTYLTIPNHYYVRDHPGKTWGLVGAKAASWAVPSIIMYGMLFYDVGEGISCIGDYESEHCNNRYDKSFKYKLMMIIGFVGLGTIYSYEMIDAPLAAGRYNKKIGMQKVFILPSINKGECRLNVGYAF